MDDRREAAIRSLRAKREFRQHLVVYATINGFLVVIWAVTWPGYFWPVWPVAGMTLNELLDLRKYLFNPQGDTVTQGEWVPFIDAEIRRC